MWDVSISTPPLIFIGGTRGVSDERKLGALETDFRSSPGAATCKLERRGARACLANQWGPPTSGHCLWTPPLVRGLVSGPLGRFLVA